MQNNKLDTGERICKRLPPSKRPARFCTEAGRIMPLICIECMQVAEIDWENLNTNDLARFSDVAFYLSSEAIRYIGPKILDLVFLQGEKVLENEFVDSFLFLPYTKSPECFLNAFNDDEHKIYKALYLEVLTNHAESDALSWASDSSFLIERYPC